MNQETDHGPITVRSQHIPANTKNHYHVSKSDLPLSCPMPDMELWNSHPRVFLPMNDIGQAKCPYCGAVYEVLSDAMSLTPDS